MGEELFQQYGVFGAMFLMLIGVVKFQYNANQKAEADAEAYQRELQKEAQEYQRQQQNKSEAREEKLMLVTQTLVDELRGMALNNTTLSTTNNTLSNALNTGFAEMNGRMYRIEAHIVNGGVESVKVPQQTLKNVEK